MSKWVYDYDTKDRLYPASEELTREWEVRRGTFIVVGWHGAVRKVTIQDEQRNPQGLHSDSK